MFTEDIADPSELSSHFYPWIDKKWYRSGNCAEMRVPGLFLQVLTAQNTK